MSDDYLSAPSTVALSPPGCGLCGQFPPQGQHLWHSYSCMPVCMPGAQRGGEAGLSTSCSLPSVPWFPGIKGTSWHLAPQVSSSFLLCFLKAPNGCVTSPVSENVSRGAAPGLTQGSGSEFLVSSRFSTAPFLYIKLPVAGDVAASRVSEAAALSQ